MDRVKTGITILATLFAIFVQLACNSKVSCAPETTQQVGSTCVALDVNPGDFCMEGTHLEGNGCVPDEIEQPIEITCGLCTMLNEQTNTCLQDPTCIPEEINPEDLCLPGTFFIEDGCYPCPENQTWNSEVEACVDIPNYDLISLQCWDSDINCANQGCQAPDPWNYNPEQKPPTCICSNEQVAKVEPLCCAKVQESETCISDSFNPYQTTVDISIHCWKNPSDDRCSCSESWKYDAYEQTPPCDCDSDLFPIVICCAFDQDSQLCVSSDFNPYPHSCHIDEQCNDNNTCTYDSCQDNFCTNLVIPDILACADDEDCVCIDGQPQFRRLIITNNASWNNPYGMPNPNLIVMRFDIMFEGPEDLHINQLVVGMQTTCQLTDSDTNGRIKILTYPGREQVAMTELIDPTEEETRFIGNMAISEVAIQSYETYTFQIMLDTTACQTNDVLVSQIISVNAQGIETGDEYVFLVPGDVLLTGLTITF